jgi:hypothetical protein
VTSRSERSSLISGMKRHAKSTNDTIPSKTRVLSFVLVAKSIERTSLALLESKAQSVWCVVCGWPREVTVMSHLKKKLVTVGASFFVRFWNSGST